MLHILLSGSSEGSVDFRLIDESPLLAQSVVQ